MLGWCVWFDEFGFELFDEFEYVGFIVWVVICEEFGSCCLGFIFFVD